MTTLLSIFKKVVEIRVVVTTCRFEPVACTTCTADIGYRPTCGCRAKRSIVWNTFVMRDGEAYTSVVRKPLARSHRRRDALADLWWADEDGEYKM